MVPIVLIFYSLLFLTYILVYFVAEPLCLKCPPGPDDEEEEDPALLYTDYANQETEDGQTPKFHGRGGFQDAENGLV